MDELVVDFGDASTQVFHVGEGSVAVPGLLAGLAEAHRRFGRLPWRELVRARARAGPLRRRRERAAAFLHEILVPDPPAGRRRPAVLRRSRAGRDRRLVPSSSCSATMARAASRSWFPSSRTTSRVRRRRARADRRRVRGYAGASPPAARRAAAPSSRGALATSSGRGAATRSSRSRPRSATATRARRDHADLTGTTQVSVIDGDGDAAALSSTLGSGSGVFRGGCQLNNMLGELDVIGTGPRAAGRRLPSMMAPTLVLDGGRPRLALGSAGSVRLAGAILQVDRARRRPGEPVDEAIAAPRIHVEARPCPGRGRLAGERRRASSPTPAWRCPLGGSEPLLRRRRGRRAPRRTAALAAAGDPRRGGQGSSSP